MEERVFAQPATMPMRLDGRLPVSDEKKERKPEHLTIVLQGHRQWALDHSLSYSDAVNAAAGRLLELIDFCAMRSMKKVTFCIFSDDLYRLPQGVHGDFLSSFMRYVTAGAQNLHRNDVRLKIEGSLEDLGGITRGLLSHIARRTHLNKGMQLIVSVNGPVDSDLSQDSGCQPDRQNFGDTVLATASDDPDFVIRTGGPLPVHRTMLWDTGKTALFFTDHCWPAFDANSLQAALDWYGKEGRTVGIQSPPSSAIHEQCH